VIPTYKELMHPLLVVSASGEVQLREAIELLAKQLGLTEEERTNLLPSGRQAAFCNRVSWAKTY